VANSDFLESSSSFELGAEEISPPRFGNRSVRSSADSNIRSNSDSVDSFDFIDKSTSVREVLADLCDGVTNPDENQTPTYHQVYAIGETSRPEEETSETFDDLENPYNDPADLMRGLGTKYVGPATR
jgi:hypothetical protein